MSEYLFLLDKLDSVTEIDSYEWFKGCYNALDIIKKGEDFLFFRMNDTIDSQLFYYQKNIKELEEIMEILDNEYAIYAYHSMLQAIINTKEGIDDGIPLEHFTLKEKIGEDELIAYYSFPKGTLEELLEMKKKSRKPIEDSMYS